MDLDGVRAIVQKHAGQRGAMISILEEVQARFGYLSADALKAVAEATDRPLVDVYGVATFYRSFRLKPRGTHVCTVCLGTACHVRGAPAVAGAFEKELGVAAGDTTPDGAFTLETVNCLGACALGPIVVTDGHYCSNVTASAVKALVDETRAGVARGLAVDEAAFPLSVSCPRCNHGLMDPAHPIGGHPSIDLVAASGRRAGRLRLSGVYGAYGFESADALPEGTIVKLFCPHCAGELGGLGVCPECEAPLVPLLVEGGAILQVCARLGCRGCQLDLSGVNR
jgi:NADH-quinone oxidoreductase subunit E